MRAYPVFAAAILMMSVTATPGAIRPDQRATVERHVFVRVTDDKSQPVAGLTPADFIIREDDIAREVLRVAPTSPPTHVALLVDDTGDAGRFLNELRAAVKAFAFSLTALPSPPAVSLMTFAERPTLAVPFTSSDAALERGIQRLFPRPNSGAYLFDAILETSQALRKLKADRPVIVAFVNDASPAFSDQRHTQVADALRNAGASLWTVQLQRTAAMSSVNEQELARVVNEVTVWSGGMNLPVLSPQGLEGAFSTLSATILGRYDVTYGRPEALIPPTRLSVEGRNPSLRVGASRWPAP